MVPGLGYGHDPFGGSPISDLLIDVVSDFYKGRIGIGLVLDGIQVFFGNYFGGIVYGF